MQQLIGTLAGMIVQGPRTALLNTLSLFDPLVRYGMSREALLQVGRNWKGFMGEAFGSLFEVFGKTLQFNSDYVNRRLELGRGDTAAVVSLKDRVRAIAAAEENPIIKGSRIVREALLGTGLPARGQKKFSTVKPLAAFTQLSQWMHAATIDGVWAGFEDMLERAVKYLSDPAHAADLANPDFKFEPGHIGYKQGWFLDDRRAFETLNQQLGDYGMNLERLAKDGVRTRVADPKASLFSNEQYRLLAQLAQNEITLESNVTNRPISFFSNPILRMASPLLGWSVARMEQLSKAFREPTGERSWAALKAGMKMFAAILPVGLAYAWLMDQYDEDVTGKKSNLREFGQDNNVLAAIEQLARVGTFGLAGDALNTVANYAAGSGDLRGISLDSRVLFMNSTLNAMASLSTVLHQQEATYATVYRGLFSALGGTGYLQYAQIMNNALSLDNAEARVTARINVGNYLRAAGRELGLDVRTGRGMASATPTPIKPWVSEMVLAAYANDPAGFRAAYQRAVQAARDEKKPDPVDYVKRSFQSYHPLKSVFVTAPSEAEYRQILGALDDDGSQDVSEAVRLFNRYGATIGIPEFDGKEQKTKKSAATRSANRSFSLDDLRRASALSLRPESLFR